MQPSEHETSHHQRDGIRDLQPPGCDRYRRGDHEQKDEGCLVIHFREFSKVVG